MMEKLHELKYTDFFYRLPLQFLTMHLYTFFPYSLLRLITMHIDDYSWPLILYKIMWSSLVPNNIFSYSVGISSDRMSSKMESRNLLK